jgi:folate-binding protein YgfZ
MATNATYEVDTLIDLSHIALLEVAGADAQSFLHSQMTLDLRDFADDSAALAAWCSPKGRVLATFTLFRLDNAFFLALAADLAARICARLKLFVLRARVNITERIAEYGQLGLSGPNSPELLRACLSAAPPARIWQVAADSGMAAIRLPGAQPRFMLAGRFEALQRLRRELQNACRVADMQAWLLQDIEAGMPMIESATSDQFLPQMLDLDRLGGLSFDKGCYPGQEIIARLRYRGEVKQCLHRGRMRQVTLLATGTPLYAPSHGEQFGTVLCAAQDAVGGTALLAVANLEAAARAPLHAGSIDGPAIDFVPVSAHA